MVPQAQSEAQEVCPASEFAILLLLALHRRGVRDVIVSPGSRSQALALAAAELEAAGLIRLHVRIDERSGAFLALGLTKATGLPTPVIVTSGSAVGNLLPAVMEAHRSLQTLVILSADRPAALRGRGASQTTYQAGIFSRFTRYSCDVSTPDLNVLTCNEYTWQPPAHLPLSQDETDLLAAHTSGATHTFSSIQPLADHLAASLASFGPSHLNLQFREPLSGQHTPISELLQLHSSQGHPRPDGVATVPTSNPAHTDGEGEQEKRLLPSAHTHCELHGRTAHLDPAHTLVVAGFTAEHYARPGTLPADASTPATPLPPEVQVLAEITSGWRACHTLGANYRERVRAGLPQITDLVIVGMPNLSREVSALLAQPDVRVYTLSHLGEETALPASATPISYVSWANLRPLDTADNTFSAREHSSAQPTRATPEVNVALTRESLITELLSYCTRNDAPVYLAASHLVRLADSLVGALTIPVYSHRGLAGIDGTISLAIGCALGATTSASPTRGEPLRLLIGDLAFLHDASSLARPQGEELPPLQIIVANDHGGHIFSTLEVAQADPAAYERVVATPMQADFASLANAYGWPHTRATTPAELERALATKRPMVIEATF